MKSLSHHNLHQRQSFGSHQRRIVRRKLTVQAVQSTFSAPPTQLLQQAQAANEQWLSSVSSSCLTYTSDTQSTCRVTLVGVVPYAPLQGEFVGEIVDQLNPSIVLIDQPQGTASDVLLPYPKWIQVLLDHQAASPSPSPQQLLSQLQHAQVTAKIGKDILDPFETFGFYTGTDFVRCAQHIALILSSMGYLPGQEYVAAVQAAQRASAQVLCIDAPLKLQEVWVNKLVKEFAVNDLSLAYQLNKAYEANAAACSEAALEWERSVGQWAVSQQDPDLVMAAYKASKAGAAALLGPKELPPALQRSAQLQPLRFRHFALRELHMSRQILDACMRLADGYSATIRRLQETDAAAPDSSEGASSLGNLSSVDGSPLGGSSRSSDDEGASTIDVPVVPGSSSDSSAGSSSSSSSSSSPKLEWVDPSGRAGRQHHIVAVVARHHLAGIRDLWDDGDSALWRGQVTREFSPSQVEVQGDPDVEHGGSRPVGQVTRGLDRLGELLR